MSRRLVLPSLLLLLTLLAACAPAPETRRVEIEQLTEPVGFYPQQTGATWQYLPNNAKLDEPRVFQRVEGPTVIDGEVYVGWQLIGRGLEVQNYRQYRDDGVYLKRRTRPGAIITFDPPLKEFPAQDELRVGASWGGETKADVFYPQAKSENQHAELTVNYTFTVVDRRTVSVVAGTFEVFVIDFVSRTFGADGEIADELRQTSWFTPYLGEVLTDTGFFLVETNVVPSEPPAP